MFWGCAYECHFVRHRKVDVFGFGDVRMSQCSCSSCQGGCVQIVTSVSGFVDGVVTHATDRFKVFCFV